MSGGWLPYGVALAACCVSMLGGWLTLGLKRPSGALMGVCAGFLIGIALLDMVPDAWRLLPPARRGLAVILIAAGAALLVALGRVLPAIPAGRRIAPHLGPASLTLHSLAEGIGIGLGFRLSPAFGWTIAAAVLAHDLADGFNVASLGIAAGRRDAAKLWLAANGLAPIAGVAVAQHVGIAPFGLALAVALLVGIFLAIAATELMPRSVRLIGSPPAALAFAGGFLLVLGWVRLDP